METNDPPGLGGDAEPPHVASDAELLVMWRAVNGPKSLLNGPLIRFAAAVREAALTAARAPQAEPNTYQQRYENLKAQCDAGLHAVYQKLGVKDSADGLKAVKGLQERVRFTEDYESLRLHLHEAEAAVVSLREQQAEGWVVDGFSIGIPSGYHYRISRTNDPLTFGKIPDGDATSSAEAAVGCEAIKTGDARTPGPTVDNGRSDPPGSPSGTFPDATVFVQDGQWIDPTPQENHALICCDCGLVHSVDFRVEDGHAQFRAYRDEARTAEWRTAHPPIAALRAPSAPPPQEEK